MSELILYDPSAEPGSVREGAGGSRIRHVTPEDYYRAQVGYVMNILAVFLNIGPTSAIPSSQQKAVDDAVADEYWNRYEGCLIPPRVLRVLARESSGSDDLASICEQARRKILSRDVSLDQATTERVRIRVAILKHGIEGVLRDRQIAVAEAIVDMFLLERAAMEDVLTAERERGPNETRASIIEQMDADESLAFETTLPVIIRPEMIRKAVPESMMEDLRMLASARTPYFLQGLFRD